MIEHTLPIRDVPGQIGPSSGCGYSNPLHTRIESYVYDSELRPVDLAALGDLLAGVPGMDAEVGFGKNMLALSCGPCLSEDRFSEAMGEAFGYFSSRRDFRNWRILFTTSPYGRLGWVRSPKNLAMMDGIAREIGNEGAKLFMTMMSTHATFRIGIGVGSVFFPDTKNLLFALANWGPSLGVHFDRKTDDDNVTRLSFAGLTLGLARGFRYLGRDVCDDLENELARIPNPFGKGEGFRTVSIWWPARVNPCVPSVEMLTLGSMRFPFMLEAMRTADRLATFALETPAHELPFLDEDDWWFFRREFLPESNRRATSFLSRFPEVIFRGSGAVPLHAERKRFSSAPH